MFALSLTNCGEQLLKILENDVFSMPQIPLKIQFFAPQTLGEFYSEIMRRKHDDHVASHSNQVNQFLHFISSSMFIYCYHVFWRCRACAMMLGLVSLTLRQSGHAIFEPPCHKEEDLLLGFNTRSKCIVFGSYLVTPLVTRNITDVWFIVTAFYVLGHTSLLWIRYGFCMSMVWFIKLVTDPFTDIMVYWPSLFSVWTSPDWKSGSLKTFLGHIKKTDNID